MRISESRKAVVDRILLKAAAVEAEMAVVPAELVVAELEAVAVVH